ncbi:MAG TPA: phage holin family protein [Actinocrinis sp.]|nr:phage holin family protein [Actinocrinis sp.]
MATKLSDLVSDATRDLSSLVRDEVALAKAEVRHDVKNAATGGGLFGAAAVLAVFALIMFSFAAAYGLHAAGLGLAWAWLVVGGGYLALGAGCGVVGLVRFKGLRGAEATKRTAGESIAILKRANH